MRFVSLDLERYGAFTNTRLTFRPDAKLHIVCGPNEAGKSSALAAITDLLFGFEARTSFDFRYKSSDLRLGAHVLGVGGLPLHFRRRKGTKGTLLDAQDGPLPDDLLLPHLGGLTREVFTRAFGLNAASLREGANTIVSSQGEAGASLLAAAAGLRHLSDLRRALDAEASGIFDTRRSNSRMFYQALDRYELARTSIRDTELRTPDWLKLNADIEAATERLATQDTTRKTLAAQRPRLERLKRIAPLLRDLDGVRAKLADTDHLPDVNPQAVADLAAAHEAHTALQADLLREHQTHAATVSEIHAISVDPHWLQHAADIERLVQLIGTYEAAQRDRPRIQAEVDGFMAQLHQQAVALGLADPAMVETKQPSAAALALVEELIREGRTLQADVLARRKEQQAADEDLALLRKSQAHGGALFDPTSLREQVQALAPLQLAHERHATLAEEVALEDKALREATARLYPAVVDLDAMARAPLPSREAMAHARQSLDEASQALQLEDSKLAAAFADEDKARTRLATLRGGRDVPSATRIADVRKTRDALWARVSQHVVGALAIPATDLTGVVVDLDRQIRLADHLVDEAARDAERVAAFDMAQADLAERVRQREAADTACERAAAAREAALADWEALWAPCGIIPQAPDAMVDWMKSLAGLLDRRAKLQENALRAHTMAGRLEAAQAGVLSLCQIAGLPDIAGLDLGTQLARLNQRVTQLEELWSGARTLQAQIETLEARHARLSKLSAQSDTQIAAWWARFSAALQALGLVGTETIDQADAALQVWRAVPNTITQRDDRARRVAGMVRNIEAFETQARALVATLAPDLGSLPAEAAVRALFERLAQVRDDAARQREMQARADRLAQSLGQTRLAHGRVRSELLDLLTRHSLIAPDTDGDIALAAAPSLLAALGARQQIQQEVQRLEAALHRLDDGLAEATLRADLAATDLDALAGDLQTLATAEERLQAETNETYAHRQSLLARRAQLETGLGAEVAVQEKLNAEAELRAAGHDYAVLRAASLLLGTALEQHRASRQDPLMQRASTLFGTLTLGAWTGLDQALDESDTMRLLARRADGDLLDVAKPVLSEGTRDQLYLALRLAYLESYAARAPATPFIGDDLFASFDEARTAQGLQALAAISGAVQPIIFTHHRHVADIAVAALGDAADVVEMV